MMPGAHRNSDTRYCGAATIVTGQGNVYVNGLLWAVEEDENSHGGGGLVSVVGSTVNINGKKVIVFGDAAVADNEDHFPPDTWPEQKSSDVFAY